MQHGLRLQHVQSVGHGVDAADRAITRAARRNVEYQIQPGRIADLKQVNAPMGYRVQLPNEPGGCVGKDADERPIGHMPARCPIGLADTSEYPQSGVPE